jgi:hypothetical protein
MAPVVSAVPELPPPPPPPQQGRRIRITASTNVFFPKGINLQTSMTDKGSTGDVLHPFPERKERERYRKPSSQGGSVRRNWRMRVQYSGIGSWSPTGKVLCMFSLVLAYNVEFITDGGLVF